MSDRATAFLIQAYGIGGEGHLEDLKTWLAKASELDVQKTKVAQLSEKATPQSVLGVILVILGTRAAAAGVSKAVEKMGDALIAWIQAKQPKTTIVIRQGDRELTIETNQLRPEQLKAELARMLPPA